jgi:predicted aldo/keto reductase-like oxidoreductase
MLSPALPPVCRLGLATRGNGQLGDADVELALEHGVNYLNWCGHPDALSRSIARLGSDRQKVVVAVQFESRSAGEAEREFELLCAELRIDTLDVATLYYVESEGEWAEIVAPGGAWEFLDEQKRRGRLHLIGLTSHQRKLASQWAYAQRDGLAQRWLDLLMIRYNAAHRGAEQDVFLAARDLKLPVVTFTALRWGALLQRTPEDPRNEPPPSAVDCYRFCLMQSAASVVLCAPSRREELEEDLRLLDDWRELSPGEFARIAAHGERVRRHAGRFW